MSGGGGTIYIYTYNLMHDPPCLLTAYNINSVTHALISLLHAYVKID